MNPERWQRIEKLFQAAIECAPKERTAFLDEVCAGDESLRRELESLIVADREAGSFIEPDAIHSHIEGDADEQAESMIGQRIGPYRVARKIGHGGMGAVYLAARADDQYRKQVAIKLIKRGMDTDFIIRRFRNERQILAALDHPNIAKLLDGGTTHDGLPYFVMEYIEGKPIGELCDENKLNTVERLKLFRGVCSAVQYAHQNLVVHRDIKPGNILITADGSPKLLDFGIAKLLNPELAAQTIDPTATAVRMMTPEYASPEQVRGEMITTASDVYSLGVVLYELLCGRRPYRFKSHQPHEIVRVICEEEPERPSTALTRVEEVVTSGTGGRITLTSEAVAASREGQPDKLRRRLRGDLDNIVLKAMRKEPSRRYSSVEQFSEDIRRHLAGLPVIARRATAAYRAGKFIKRHRAGVIAAGLIVLALIAGLATTLWQARTAHAERARAEAEQARAERRFNDVRQLANSFMFEVHDEIENLSGSTKARELLVRRALEYLDGLAQEAGGDPSLQRELATAYLKVGDIHDTIGDKNGALQSYRKALQIFESLSNADPTNAQAHRDLSDNYARLSDLLGVTGDTAGSLELSLKALALDEKLATENPHDVKATAILAGSYMGTAYLLGVGGNKVGEMENYRKALAIREGLAAADPSKASARADLADSLRHLGVAVRWYGDTDAAIIHLRRALIIDSELSSADSTNARVRRKLSASYTTLSEALEGRGDHKGALENYRKALTIREEMAAADPKSASARGALAQAHINIGRLLVKMGDLQGAIKSTRRALEISESLSSADPTNARALYYVSLCHINIGNEREKVGGSYAARESYARAVSILDALVAADPTSNEFHPDLARACSDLARLHCAQTSSSKVTFGKQIEHWRDARSWHQRSLGVFLDLRNRGALSGSQSGKLDEIGSEIAKCDAALAKLQGVSVRTHSK